MTDNKKSESNPKNPFGQFNSNNKKGTGKPKFNAYWIYGIIAVVFLIVQFYVSNSRNPVETTWSKVKTTMLANGDIERIVVVNDKVAKVYLKKDRVKNYEHEFKNSFSKPGEFGPQFQFNTGPLEKFANDLTQFIDSDESIMVNVKGVKNFFELLTLFF